MKILLTGGSGFIGRNLQESLATQHEVHAPARSELDVTDARQVDRLLSSSRFDTVIHAATPAVPTCDQIVGAYNNLVRHRPLSTRLLFFGSGAEYGKHRDLSRIREDEIGRERPRDPYGLGKLLCTEHARTSTGILNLRLFGVYGKYEPYLFKFISNAIVKVLLRCDVIVRQDVIFDYLFVPDLTRIVGLLLEREWTFADINVTPSRSISLAEALDILRDVSGQDFHARFESPGLNFEYTGSNERLLEILPNLSFTSYEDGIASLHRYYLGILPSLDLDGVMRDEYRGRCRPRAEQLDQR